MSLDQNLFTLNLVQRPDNSAVIDLVDTNGTAHYRKQRIPGSVYKIELVDPLSESVLATATAPSATNKHKTIELYNPNLAIDLRYTGTLSTRWKFKWEDHEFEWKKEECFIIRKPDPPVLVAITKEPSSRVRSWTVQILDYNINRFDIEDRKGLEIVILTALLTFGDSSDTYHPPGDDPPPYSDPIPSSSTAQAAPASLVASSDIKASPEEPLEYKPPTPPPKPTPKTGIDRIAEVHAMREEINEVTVDDEGLCMDYARYCYNLLQDEAMLFITVRSASPEQVPKVLHVVEEAKRLRHQAGIAYEEELHQYVVYDTKPVPRKVPRVINLDDPPSTSLYTPPSSLTVHLSKIPMPELQPKPPAQPEPAFNPEEFGTWAHHSDSYPTPSQSPKEESHKGKGKEKVLDPKGKGKEKQSSKDRKKREKMEKEEKEREKKEQEDKDKREKEERERERKERERREKESPKQKAKREKKEREQEVKDREREERERRERERSRLSKRRASSSGNLHVPSNQMHPSQPSPSPAQLNNPGIYMAPPPPRSPRPAALPGLPRLRIPLPEPQTCPRPLTSYAHARFSSWTGGDRPDGRRLSTAALATDLYDLFNYRRT